MYIVGDGNETRLCIWACWYHYHCSSDFSSSLVLSSQWVLVFLDNLIKCFFHPIIQSKEKCSKVMSGTPFIIFIAIKLIIAMSRLGFAFHWPIHILHIGPKEIIYLGDYGYKSSKLAHFWVIFNTSYNEFKKIFRKGESMEISDSWMNLIKHKLYQ